MFKNLHGFVSRHAIQIIVDELCRANKVGIDKIACGCITRTTHGLPCACELAMCLMRGMKIPLDLVDGHWKSLRFGDHQPQQE